MLWTLIADAAAWAALLLAFLMVPSFAGAKWHLGSAGTARRAALAVAFGFLACAKGLVPLILWSGSGLPPPSWCFSAACGLLWNAWSLARSFSHLPVLFGALWAVAQPLLPLAATAFCLLPLPAVVVLALCRCPNVVTLAGGCTAVQANVALAGTLAGDTLDNLLCSLGQGLEASF